MSNLKIKAPTVYPQVTALPIERVVIIMIFHSLYLKIWSFINKSLLPKYITNYLLSSWSQPHLKWRLTTRVPERETVDKTPPQVSRAAHLEVWLSPIYPFILQYT